MGYFVGGNDTFLEILGGKPGIRFQPVSPPNGGTRDHKKCPRFAGNTGVGYEEKEGGKDTLRNPEKTEMAPHSIKSSFFLKYCMIYCNGFIAILLVLETATVTK